MLVYSNLIGSPSGDKGNLCTYAQLILTRDGLKKEGRHSGGPKSLDVQVLVSVEARGIDPIGGKQWQDLMM